MDIPSIGPDELLVKVWASGICGSDVLEWYRAPKAPLVLGHEIAGEIVEVGQDVRVGKKVIGYSFLIMCRATCAVTVSQASFGVRHAGFHQF